VRRDERPGRLGPGIIWAPPNGANLEAGWHGWQLVVGNAYMLTGLALLMLLIATAAHCCRAGPRERGPSDETAV
jgi:hypothetical protein